MDVILKGVRLVLYKQLTDRLRT